MTLKEKFQAKFDKEFPEGAVASWIEPPDAALRPVIYNIPLVEVTAMAGLDPVITLVVYGTGSKVLGPWRVTNYEIISEGPLTARVTFDNVDAPLMLVGAVGDHMALMMAHDRALHQENPYPESSWTLSQARPS